MENPLSLLVQLLSYVVLHYIIVCKTIIFLYDNHTGDKCIQYNKCIHEHKVLVQLEYFMCKDYTCITFLHLFPL